jgi:hypothetical protein
LRTPKEKRQKYFEGVGDRYKMEKVNDYGIPKYEEDE